MKHALTGKWAVDTNIVLYAFNADSPFHDRVGEFFKSSRNGERELYIAQQSILEAEQVLTHGYHVKLAQAIHDIEECIDIFGITVVQPLPTTLSHYHKLLLTHQKADIFDMFLAATLLDNKITQLVTINTKDFPHIPHLKLSDLT